MTKPSPSIHDGWTPQPQVEEQPRPSETPRTDAIIDYLAYQFPATVGHIPLREMIGAIERDARFQAARAQSAFDCNADLNREFFRATLRAEKAEDKLAAAICV